MSGYLLRPCKSSAAFEALPDKYGKTYNLNLDKCKNLLIKLGYEEVSDVKIMIIVKKDIEVSLYPSGKLILKTDSQTLANEVMNEIYDKILEN